jgi:hypothetical protein
LLHHSRGENVSVLLSEGVNIAVLHCIGVGFVRSLRGMCAYASPQQCAGQPVGGCRTVQRAQHGNESRRTAVLLPAPRLNVRSRCGQHSCCRQCYALQLLIWGGLPCTTHPSMVPARDAACGACGIMACAGTDAGVHCAGRPTPYKSWGTCISCHVLALIGWFPLCSVGERIMQRCRHLVGVCAPFWRSAPLPCPHGMYENGAGMHRAGQPVYW